MDGKTGVRRPLENHNVMGSLAILVLKKSQSYQASIHCWAIIGPPAKLARRDGPLKVIFGSSHPLVNKKENEKEKKRCQSWTPLTKLSGTAHEQPTPADVLKSVDEIEYALQW